MMNDQTELILIACLDRLELGDSIDEILRAYPDVAADLRPVLETAVWMNQLAISPTLAAKESSRKEMMAHADTLRAPRTRPASWGQHLRRVLLPVASLALLLVMLGAVLVPVSASALPGDALYGLKRQVEAFQLWRTSDPDALLELVETLRDERHREVEALLRGNRDAVVELEGLVEVKGEATWQIAGFEVQITAVTERIGDPEVGDLVLVNGHTSGGHLFADKIVVQSDGSEPLVMPTATTVTHTPTVTAAPSTTVTSSPTSTQTTTPTATPTATMTATSELTSTIEPTLSPTPTATPTLLPLPTATAVPTRSDDSGGGDENSNDNEDNSGSNDNEDNSGSNDNDNEDNSGSGNNNNDNDNDDNSGSGNNNNDNDNDDNSGSGNNNNDNDNDDNSGRGGGGDNDNDNG